MSEASSSTNFFAIDRRAHKRILVNIPIEVTSVDSNGRLVSEHSFIEDVSDYGCRLSTREPVNKGDVVALKILSPRGTVLPDEEPRYYEIMWVAPKGRGATMGGRLVENERLANLNFPWPKSEENPPQLANADRRTDARLILHAQVQIFGIADTGHQFVERSSVEDISALGCRFSLENIKVQTRTVLGVEPLGEAGEKLAHEQPSLFVVLWVKENGKRLTVGARSLTEKELTDSTGAPFSQWGFAREKTDPAG